jgi:anti-sigma factor RsiW
MAPSDLTCAELVELVTDYLEGRLRADERERLEAHLGDCPGCTAHVEQLRTTVALAGRLREADLPPQARADLLAAFRAWLSVA